MTVPTTSPNLDAIRVLLGHRAQVSSTILGLLTSLEATSDPRLQNSLMTAIKALGPAGKAMDADIDARLLQAKFDRS